MHGWIAGARVVGLGLLDRVLELLFVGPWYHGTTAGTRSMAPGFLVSRRWSMIQRYHGTLACHWSTATS